MKGYTTRPGHAVPYATTFAGLYQHATGKDPFQLPPSWIKAKSSLKLNTPFDFVSTTDTHGGNSGSPTVNTKGEIVGILFDGNIEGLPNRYLYTDDERVRVHVAGNAIIESLRSRVSRRADIGRIGISLSIARRNYALMFPRSL